MAHFNADEARSGYAPSLREPITFELGGETFTTLTEPMLGDVLTLADAPELDPENTGAAVIAISRFVERMLPLGDRERFRRVLDRIPSSQSGAVVELGGWLVQQISGNPTKRSGSFRSGPRTTGGRSKTTTVGRRNSA